jgi:hypothetical protein
MQSILILLLLPVFVLSEGYICPIDSKYTSLGQTSQNYLLYSYYDASGNTWITKNQYGFTSPEMYCRDKGDANLHPNENLEVKCNDSRLICAWQNNNCVYTGNYQCSSIALCDAVLNHQESPCLGSDCATGGNNDFLYTLYCNENTPTPITPSDILMPTDLPITPTDTLMPTDLPITPTDTLMPTDLPITPTDTLMLTDLPITPTDTLMPTDLPITPPNNQILYIMYPDSNICKEKIIYM